MKSILLKFADNVLSKNEMKALKGGNIYDGTGKTCGHCVSTTTGTVYACGGTPVTYSCRCPTGNANNACG